MLTSKLGVASIYLATFLAYTLFHPSLLVLFTSTMSYLGMQEFVKLRSTILERQTVTVHYKRRTSMDASSSSTIEQTIVEKEPPKEHSMAVVDKMQMSMRCWMCVAYSMIGFGLSATMNLHSVYYQMAAYIAGTLALLFLMMGGTVLGILDSGLRIDEEFVKEDIAAMALDFVGVLWIGGGFSVLYSMAQVSASFTLLLFFASWIGDISHTVSSKIMGTFVTYQDINSEKTLEGNVLAIIASAVFAFFFKILLMPMLGHGNDLFSEQSHFNFAVIAGLTALFGIAGDLFLSYMKRVGNVKDSGDTFYEFGGVLDVFDSVLTASPIMFVGLQTLYA